MTGKVVGQYVLTGLIGHGAFASVWECQHVHSKEMYACKIISVASCLQDDVFPHFRNELEIQSKINHPCITQLKDVMIDEENVYMVMELCMGGGLNEIIEDYEEGMPEEDAKMYVYQIMSALAYIHDLHVAHRDIKLENILVTAGDRVKLIDFGLGKQSGENDRMKTTCGTLLYAAPEILNEVPYNGMKVDIWSAGIVLYVLVGGHFPWMVDGSLSAKQQIQETTNQILSGEINMPDGISFELMNLISEMLEVDPELRPTAKQILEHQWFEGEVDETAGINTDPDPDLVQKVESVIKHLSAMK